MPAFLWCTIMGHLGSGSACRRSAEGDSACRVPPALNTCTCRFCLRITVCAAAACCRLDAVPLRSAWVCLEHCRRSAAAVSAVTVTAAFCLPGCLPLPAALPPAWRRWNVSGFLRCLPFSFCLLGRFHKRRLGCLPYTWVWVRVLPYCVAPFTTLLLYTCFSP